MADAARRSIRGEARGRLSRRCVQLPGVPAAGAVSVLAGKPRCRAVRRSGSRTFVAATAIGILPATVTFAVFGAGLDSVIAAQQVQYNRLPCRRTHRLQGRFRSVHVLTPTLLLALGAFACWRWFPRSPAVSSGASSTPALAQMTNRIVTPDRGKEWHGRAAHPRSLRHWRRLRRAVDRGRGRHAWRAGGADRKGPDGRRVPQHRLRAVEGDDRGGQARRCDAHQRAVRRQGRASRPSSSTRSTTTSIASSTRSHRTIPRSASPVLASA